MKNCFDRTPHTMKDWLLLAAGVAAVFAAADWLPGVLRGAGAFLGLLAPFGWGLLLASLWLTFAGLAQQLTERRA